MGNREGPGLPGSPNSNFNLVGGNQKIPHHHQALFFTLLDPTPRPVPSPGAPGLSSSPGTEMHRGETFRPRLPRPSSPSRGGREPRKPRSVPGGVEGLGRASRPDGPRPPPARGGARGSGRRTGRRLTHLGCQSFQLRGYLVPPPPPLLSRDPGALRLITFPDTTWPSAAAQRSASCRPNRPPRTLRSRPGLRRKPKRRRRRRRRRAGEADGRSGFRLSPQRRTRRREWRREGEAEEGEATSLPGPRAARDAGTQEEEDGEEEAVARLLTLTEPRLPRLPAPPAAPPLPHGMLGARGGAGARRARREGRGRLWGRSRLRGAGPGERRKPIALLRPGLASAPRGPRQGPRPAVGDHGRGDLRHHLHKHTLPNNLQKAPDPGGLGSQV